MRPTFVALDPQGLTFHRRENFSAFARVPTLAAGFAGLNADWAFAAALGSTSTLVRARRLPATRPDENLPPSAQLDLPPPGHMVVLGNQITFNATAADEDGLVQSVTFYAGGVPIGNDATAPQAGPVYLSARGRTSLQPYPLPAIPVVAAVYEGEDLLALRNVWDLVAAP